MSEGMKRYEKRRREEFLEYLRTELNVARDKLKVLDEKFKEYLGAEEKIDRAGYLCGTRGRIGKAGEFLLEGKEFVVGRIKYMENFIGNAS